MQVPLIAYCASLGGSAGGGCAACGGGLGDRPQDAVIETIHQVRLPAASKPCGAAENVDWPTAPPRLTRPSLNVAWPYTRSANVFRPPASRTAGRGYCRRRQRTAGLCHRRQSRAAGHPAARGRCVGRETAGTARTPAPRSIPHLREGQGNSSTRLSRRPPRRGSSRRIERGCLRRQSDAAGDGRRLVRAEGALPDDTVGAPPPVRGAAKYSTRWFSRSTTNSDTVGCRHHVGRV